jgi:hypothetical protein
MASRRDPTLGSPALALTGANVNLSAKEISKSPNLDGGEARTGSSMSGWSTDGLKRVYIWLPNTAADTSNPEPTLPWARQCTNCATLCAKCRDAALASWSGAIKPVWMSRAVTREVMSAADEPSPVLATSASATPVGLKGGVCASEASPMGKPRLLSYRVETR